MQCNMPPFQNREYICTIRLLSAVQVGNQTLLSLQLQLGDAIFAFGLMCD